MLHLFLYDDAWAVVKFMSLIGQIILVAVLIISVMTIVALGMGYFAYRRGRILFPSFILFVIDSFYTPLRKVLKFFRRDPRILDDISIVLRNHVNYGEYARVPPEKRIILLPQCLRHVKCPAPMSSEDGFHCMRCGLCDIAKIYKVAESVGTELYIAPGGSFAKRLLYTMHEKKGKEAVLGVACHSDLYEGMFASKLKGIPSQGVPLLREGCVSTLVDVGRVVDMLLVGVEEARVQDIKEGIR